MKITGKISAIHTAPGLTKVRVDINDPVTGVTGTIFITSDKEIKVKKGNVKIELP